MNKGNKNLHKGITLIALVITIIVLLILAGVSIAMLTGDNGILTKATESKKNSIVAEEKEYISMAYNVVKANKLDGTSSGNITAAELKAELDKQDKNTAVEGTETLTITYTKTGHVYKITQDGKISANGSTTPTTPEEPETPVVKTALENAESAKPSGANITVTDASKGIVMVDSNGNEWVWIEVPDTVFSEATKTNPSSENIKTDLISYATDYREGKTGQGCNWTDEWYAKDGSTYISASTEGLTETQKALSNGCGLTYDEYNTKYNNMLRSVYENKGFYIGRYEAGIEGSDTDVSKARTSHTDITSESPVAVSKKDMIPYNYVYCSEAQSLSNGMATGEKTSSLMFGIQWNLVCKYLEVKTNLETVDIKTDSTSWGNYKNKSLTLKSGKYNIKPFSSSSVWTAFSTDTENYITNKTTSNNTSYKQLLTTGASEDTNKMNIYDLAGNEWEWTLEKTSDGIGPCANRGGCYNDDGSSVPASSCWNGNTTISYDGISFRTSLY